MTSSRRWGVKVRKPSTKSLSCRLDRLEMRFEATGRWPVMLWMMGPIKRARRKALASNERIVEDWYRDFKGIVWARERITTDPADEGQRCEPGGYLQTVICELHETCEFREDGSCMNCVGLDLTGSEMASDTCPHGDAFEGAQFDANGFRGRIRELTLKGAGEII